MPVCMKSDTPRPDVTSVSHMDALPAGTRLGEFELTALLGVGGFGMVYSAWDHSLDRTVAIKEYMPAALAGRSKGAAVSMRSSADQQTFVAGLRSFVSEAKLLARFDHPSLVKVYRFWEENNTAYMAMPLYQGMTLKQARRHMRSPPPEPWLRQVLWSILEALKVLHESGTMHRDVSPDNIFLQNIGPPVLLDLGAARRAITDRSHKHTAILKVNYAPIEQYADAADLRQGPWTDLYAVGAVVHGCLCNEAPLPATFRVIRDRLTPFSDVAQTVQEHFGLGYSEAFVSAIASALQVQPGDRPQSVAALQALMQLQVPQGIAQFDWRHELADIWVENLNEHDSASGVLADIDLSAGDQGTHVLSHTVPGDAAAEGLQAGRHAVGDGLTLDTTHLTAPMPEHTLPMSGNDDQEGAQLAGPSSARPTGAGVPDVRPEVQAPARQASIPASQVTHSPANRTRGTGKWLAAAFGVAVVLAGFLTIVWRETSNGEGFIERQPGAASVPPNPSRGDGVGATGGAEPSSTAASAAKPDREGRGSASMPGAMAGAPIAGAASMQREVPVAPRQSPSPVAAPTGKPTPSSAGVGVPPPAGATAPSPETKPEAATTRRDAGLSTPRLAAPVPSAERATGKAAVDEICGDAGLFARPMCVFRECQKAQNAEDPTCVEQKRKAREDAERINAR